MIRVTIEIVPFGDEARKRTVGRMVVGLQQVDRAKNLGDYVVRVETDKFGTSPELTLTDEFQIFGHPRSEGVFELLRRCFEELQIQRGVL